MNIMNINQRNGQSKHHRFPKLFSNLSWQIQHQSSLSKLKMTNKPMTKPSVYLHGLTLYAT